MSDDEATVAADHLHRAEVPHHAMEGRLEAAEHFWRPGGGGKFIKDHPEPEAPQAGPHEAAGFDAAHVAHVAHQEALRERARQAAAARMAAEQAQRAAARAALEARWPRERVRREKDAGTYDSSTPRTVIGRSQRFF